jgi:TonB family protein
MAPVSKEMIGGTSVQDSALQPHSFEPKPAAGNIRSDAVSLEVPVKVHGSRPATNGNSQSERFEEKTNTMIVFPEGGVLRMATTASAGQMLVLTNLKSSQDAICRVVKVRTFSNTQSYVEVEFTRPQAGYWGVHFPSDRPAPDSVPSPATATTRSTAKTAEPALGVHLPAAPPEAPGPELIDNISDPHKTNPTTLPLPPAPLPPARPTSSFVSFGTQEKVQLAATATSRPSSTDENPRPHSPYGTVPISAEPSPPASGVRDASPTSTPPKLDEIASSAAASVTTVTERVPAGSVADISSLPDLDEVSAAAMPAHASSAFGTRLDTKLLSAQATSAEPRQSWLLVTAAIVVLLAAAAGGAWYFRGQFAKPAVPARISGFATQPKQPVQQSPDVAQPPELTRTTSTRAAASRSAAPIPANDSAKAPAEPANTNEGSPKQTRPTGQRPASASVSSPQRVHSTVDASAASASIPSTSAPDAASSMLTSSAMKAHPLSSQRAIDVPGNAPVLNVASETPHEAGGLASIPSSAVALPPPPPAAEQQPTRVGGSVEQPKLISSVMPVYPFSAREANIQGDVVIDTRIGPNGSVTHMQVISGPTMLRQAALDALRRWKYQPSELDGKPVAVQMLVTIRFRL